MAASADQDALDALVREFFAAFTNKNGEAPNVRRVYDLAIPRAVIVRGGVPMPEVYSLREFVEPRQDLLTGGTLLDFEEREVSEHTVVADNVAQRHSSYRKTGTLDGRPFEIQGTKLFQFVRLPVGWRISALSWADEPETTAMIG